MRVCVCVCVCTHMHVSVYESSTSTGTLVQNYKYWRIYVYEGTDTNALGGPQIHHVFQAAQVRQPVPRAQVLTLLFFLLQY